MAINRYMSVVFLLRLLSYVILFNPVQTGDKKNGNNKVLLLLLDGLRWDLFGADIPALRQVEANGVRVDWMDTVFPTMSSPSMFSIATGLYPESHNIVANHMFDTTGQITWHWNEAFLKPEYAYWWDQPGVEPAWVTAISQGLKAGSIGYPGAQLPIHDTVPTKFVSNENEFNLTERIDIAMSYFVDDDFDLAFLYWEEPDDTLHKHGIGSPEMYEKLAEIDEGVRYLFESIRVNKLDDVLDVIIMSDHGMTDGDVRKVVHLYDDGIINPRDVQYIHDGNTITQIEPRPGKLDKVYQDLRSNTKVMQVYKRDEMDSRFHYGGSKRNLQIIGISDPGWAFTISSNFEWGNHNAHHGYDNKLMDMKSILFAQGPSFKKGYRAKNMESVNVYPMICEILHLTPNPNNGSRENYIEMLALTEESTPTHLPNVPTKPMDSNNTPPKSTASEFPMKPSLPQECGTPPEPALSVRTLSLVVLCLSMSTLVFGVATIYYCGRYGLFKNGLFVCCTDDEERSHAGFISLANDIDMDEDDEV